MKSFQKILIATDFSDCSEEACAYALDLARKFDASLLVLHVINEPVDLRGFYVPHISFDQLEKEIAEGAATMLETFCKENLQDFNRYSSLVTPRRMLSATEWLQGLNRLRSRPDLPDPGGAAKLDMRQIGRPAGWLAVAAVRVGNVVGAPSEPVAWLDPAI